MTEIGHIQSCAEKLLLVTEEDLRPVCVECHATISLAQRKNISFEEAKIEKQVISFGKESVNKQKDILTNTCKYETIATSVTKRKQQYREWLIKQKEM